MSTLFGSEAWVKAFDGSWYAYYRDGVERFRISRRELVECEDPAVLLMGYKLAARVPWSRVP